ncbi:YadA-like family protein [Megasphaera elsdenii]|uniref:YadA-like family protein n=1 Tax=Megasphaera elsdenii TaxID=907 RepID=UPI003F7ECE0C
MKSEGKTVTKKYVSPIMTDMPIEYTVTEQVPIKDHTKDIKNAVMVGYNTDVTQNGGVALGSDSVASTEAGKTGYDAQGKKHNNSDTDYSAWVSTDAAVSVGGADREVTYDVLDKNGKPVIDKATGKKKQGTQIVKSTRQITNLAAGTENTDAVNVAQLESVDKKVAVIFDDKGSLMSTDARMTHDIGSEGQSLALGKGAHAWMQAGSKANMILFGMQKAAGAIAIGEGAEALSQSIDIGNRTYTGDIGDVTISKYGNSGSGSGVGSVLLGTNSYTGGTFSTLIGDYSIMSTVYPNNYDSKKSGSSSYLQNAGAVSVGALNSIESATSSNDFSGVANSIVGLANKTNNANGALIYGAGNTITNSFADVATPDSAGSAAKAAQSFRKSVQNNPGGAALAIGGGNTIDRSIRSQVIGVNNKLTGNLYHEDGIYAYGYPIKPAVNEYSNQYNMVDGYNNQVANVNHAYVIGANNIIQGKTFTDATKNGVLSSKADRDKAKKDDNLIVIGDNHTLANDVSNNIILGTADKTLTTSVSNAVMIGHNADVQKNGGVALGADSIAYTEAKKTGYDPQGKAHDASDAAWVSTDAAVSVGGADREVKYKDKEGKEKTRTVKSTRQITNVAAGTQDTDAVNVAQLKAVSSAINTDITASKTHFYSVNSTDTKAKNYNNNGATGTNALAAGVGASAEADHSIAIGTGAWTNEGDGRVKGSGDIAIGHNATIHNYVNQSGSIALGQNALIENTFGSTEKNYAFNQTTFTSYGSGFLPADANKEATGIAIGRNSFARTGSLMVGTHMYKGAIADMDEVDGTNSDTLLNRDFNNINMTTLGTNSFNNGTFATVTGAYSATTAKKKIQNFAATIDGSLNSIESYKYQDKDAADNSGVASSIVGTANRIANSNNTTILGAGNEVTNSLTDIVAPKEGGDSAKDLQDTLKGKLQQDEKGAIVVSGIGNTVDSSHGVSVLGSRNVVKTTDNIQLLGDNREVAGANGSVIIGSADSKMRTSVTDATILGHNANVEKTGGVALGAGSVASREAGVAGYDPATKTDSTDSSATWKATDAAVSVGKADGTMTRQITGVAAGSAATDAVNVAQLQKALSGAKDGNDTLKSDTNALTLNGNTLSMNVEDTAGHTVSGSVNLSELAQAVDTNTTYTLTGEANPDNNTTTITFKDSNGNKNSVTVATKDTDTRNTVKAGENVTLDTKDNADGSHEYTVNVKADGKVEAGSTKIVSGGTVYNETRVAKDGAFVKQSNTAGENLSALDNQVTANTESIYHMNGRISDLDNRVNKVGAGAAALAALHPLDFDPDDKWDFAVGYGNYRNANSVALGAFYRPNEDTMFSLGTNFGNGENMFNAGVSFKIGQGSGITTSKTAMAKKIESLENTVDQQDKKIAELEALVKEQGEMIRQYVGKK